MEKKSTSDKRDDLQQRKVGRKAGDLWKMPIRKNDYVNKLDVDEKSGEMG